MLVPDGIRSGMRRTADPGIPGPAETRPDNLHRITIRVIAPQAEPITVIILEWPEAGIPDIIIRRQHGLYQGTGVTAVRLIAHLRPLLVLVQGPVTACKRSGDQDKLNIGGLFHVGVAGRLASLKLLFLSRPFRYPFVIPSLFARYQPTRSSTVPDIHRPRTLFVNPIGKPFVLFYI
jgi:hypothetical protein